MLNEEILLLPEGLLSISEGVPKEWRQKLKYSLLYSHLYARSTGDKFDALAKWRAGYSRAMENLEWTTLANKASSFEPKDEAVIVLSDLLGEKLISDVKLQAQLERLIASVEDALGSEALGAAIREQLLSPAQAKDKSDTTVFVHVSLIGVGPVVHTFSMRFRTAQCIDELFFKQRFTGKHVVGQVSVNVSTRQLSTARYERNGIEQKVRRGLPTNADSLLVELSSAGCPEPHALPA
ncbi:hypothetical protein J3P96_24755 [Pseudomonas sp. R3-56]|uniref:hypothetical protein n=1 Tax=Pseudomonas sp. R3-56 TaxID=2817401 RepID=UPI003DA8A6BB